MSLEKPAARPPSISGSVAPDEPLSGRRTASQNARRHGLSAQVWAGSGDWQRMQDLAKAICGDLKMESRGWDIAQAAASAHLELEKIRLLKAPLYECLARALSAVPHPAYAATGEQPADSRARTFDEVLVEIQALAAKLHRYERRALSRRTRALENLTAFAISPA